MSSGLTSVEALAAQIAAISAAFVSTLADVNVPLANSFFASCVKQACIFSVLGSAATSPKEKADAVVEAKENKLLFFLDFL